MHRSGTSCVTGSLVLAGATAGYSSELTGISAENPKGFWERRDLRNFCDVLLQESGAEWWQLAEFSIDQIAPELKEKSGAMAKMALRQLSHHEPWVAKEPRLCVLLPMLLEYVDNPVCVHVYRNPLEVARSLNVRNAIPIQFGLALWEFYNRMAVINSQDLPVVRIAYEALLRDPKKAMNGLIGRLARLGVSGLRQPDSHELVEFVDTALNRQRVEKGHAEQFLTESQRWLWQNLRSGRTLTSQDMPEVPESTMVGLRDLATTKLAMDGVTELEASVRQKQGEIDRLQQFDRGLVAPVAAQVQRIESGLDSHLQRLESGLDAQVQRLESALESQGQRLETRLDTQSQAHETKQKLLTEQISAERQLREKLEAECKALHEQVALQREMVAETQKARTQLEHELVQAREQHESELDEAAAETTAVKDELSDARARLQIRFEEIAKLTQLVIERENQMLLDQKKPRLSWVGIKRLARPLWRFRRKPDAVQIQCRMLRESALFDAEWYLKTYPDVADAGIAAELHYLVDGAKEGRHPGPAFDNNAYLRSNRDVVDAGVNPLVHYLSDGQFEGREISPAATSDRGTSDHGVVG